MNPAGRDAQSVVGCFENFCISKQSRCLCCDQKKNKDKDKHFYFIGSAIILRKSNAYLFFCFRSENEHRLCFEMLKQTIGGSHGAPLPKKSKNKNNELATIFLV